MTRVFSSNMRFLDVTVGEYDRGANDVGARTIQVKHKIIHPDFVPSTLKDNRLKIVTTLYCLLLCEDRKVLN